MISQNDTAANKDPRGFLLEMNLAHPNNGKVVPRNRSQLKKPPPQWNNQNDFKDANSQRKNLKKPPPPPPRSVPSFYPKLKDEPSATATATITDDSNSFSGTFASFLGQHDGFVRTNENTIVDISDLSNSMKPRRREVTQHTSPTRTMSGSRSQESDDGSLSVHRLFLAEEDDAVGYGHSVRRGAEASNSSRRKQPHLHMSYTEGLGPSYRGDSRRGSSQPRRHHSHPLAPPRRYYPHEGAPDRQFRPPTTQRRSPRHDQTAKGYVPPPTRRYYEGPSEHKNPGHYYEQRDSLYDDRDTQGYYPDPYVQEQGISTRSRWGEMARSESYLDYVHESHHINGQEYALFQEDAVSPFRYDDHRSSSQDPYYSQDNRRARGYRDERPRESSRRHGRALVGIDQRNHRSLSELVPRQEERLVGTSTALNRAVPNGRNVSRSVSRNKSGKPAVRPGAFPMVGRGKLEIPQSCLRRASFEQEDNSSSSPRSAPGEKKAAPTSIKDEDKDDKDEVYVQVAPGVDEKLRRVVETKNAIKAGFYSQGMCWGCCTGLYCVSDASFLICPKCTVISPLEDCVSGSYGVGVGFTNELLEQMKEEARRDARAA